ncbi:uncharacterized protein IL334_007654 [Kwoniella shivajii]|uniref:Uncharacterized protein n=1 Tax=Kwoniella shivajii TaxID=564305 RepID=A0ABZ1DCE1_9TREE|nr:hypothetical protein IL334_007654 [Kwoniella shivajii]
MHQPDLLNLQQESGPPKWAPHMNYPYGAVVFYAGTYWRSEGNHTSRNEPEGAPTNNLSLWTPVGSSGGYPTHTQQQQQQQQQYQAQSSYFPQQHLQQQSYSPQQGYYGQSQPPSYSPHSPAQAPGYPQQGYHASSSSSSNLYAASPQYSNHQSSSSSSSEKNDTPSSGETVTNEKGLSSSTSFFSEKANESLRYLTMKKESNDVNDKDELKHELKGRRIWRTGGIGVWAYSENAKEEELKKKLWKDWSDDHDAKDWAKIAKERKDFYEKESKGVKPLFTWKLVEKGQRLPSDALPIGHEQDGAVLYAARSWWEGGIHLGKAGHHLNSGASISYGGAEITLDTYEILCGPINEPYLVKWMSYRHGEVATVQGWQPIEGGREKDGTALLLAKGDYENGQHPGKCLINDDHACVGYGGGELWVRPFSILAYANPDRR